MKQDTKKAKKPSNFEANRKRKLQKQLKLQPNNEQVKKALQDIHYRRKTPKTNMWSHSWIKLAQLIKSVTGKFDPKIMSSNEKVASEALRLSRKEQPYYPPKFPKSLFSIQTRAHG